MSIETAIATQLAEVRERIATAATKAGRSPDEVTLIAVTKTHPASSVLAAASLGITDVGENRVQEALEKITATRKGDTPPLRWHLIGHLQSNKAKYAVEHFDLVHSVDSLDLATALNRHAERAGKMQQILLQVNVSGEESKFGLSADQVQPTLESILASCPAVEVRGFMTMAPFVDDPELARPHFAALRDLSQGLAEKLSNTSRFNPTVLSMGMTIDFHVAIEEGSTMVRIGSAIFGVREPH